MLRGREVSRIEGFSDAVFGFALTLLVVSLEVPNDFSSLRQTLIGFPAFAVTFAVVFWIWYEHYAFFRMFALKDGLTAALNAVLLFVVMFFVYPLKFVFTRLIVGNILGQGPGITYGMTPADARLLMIAYSAGFVAVYAVFTAFYWNAWRQRLSLELSTLQIYDARAGMTAHMLSVALGAASVVLAALLPIGYLSAAGLIFFFLGPMHGTYGYLNGRRRDRLEASLCPPSGNPPPVTRSAGASSA